MKSAVHYRMKEIKGDIYTPISIFSALKGTKKFLLESSLKHSDQGRYSFIGLNPYEEFKGSGGMIEMMKGDTITHSSGSLIKGLQKHLQNQEFPDIPFPFKGGAIGYVGYDVIRQIEKIGVIPEDSLQLPDVHFMLYDTFIIFDHLKDLVTILVIDPYREKSLDDLENELSDLVNQISEHSLTKHHHNIPNLQFSLLESKENFIKNVEIAQKHIVKGDIFQMVLSQRAVAEMTAKPFDYYRSLRSANPSPYMFYIDFDDYILLGASPESLLKVQGKTVVSNPIAGTRPRSDQNDLDHLLQMELMGDQKELAEHKMLVDLARNDVGKICHSVRVDKYMQVERYEHVMHLVSEVKGDLREGFSGFDALEACLPAGTVSGAPKIRAMQIINDLERFKRGPYSGAVGYISGNGEMDLALSIRMMLVKNDRAYIQAGAGIVFDSVPEKEYEETLHKMKSLMEVGK
ncbi:anthranilate synthase subunit I [Bacillus coahuilensis p1.1.43]|uniref:Anthranilate synthase component 1 n=1 Tax=Bacillus coahuilensis p1.1.43 TaxID=1150625 RepID=A0A147K8H3_9BACI|nr:anthranilate synthase component I [Bacillus coahuilensis]KUP06437.1 anthranilate synthase subunit I [Bacillus coahuilensis p1.1.43]